MGEIQAVAGVLALSIGVGFVVWIARSNARARDADHVEEDLDAVKKAESAREKFRFGGGLRGAFKRGLSNRPTDND